MVKFQFYISSQKKAKASGITKCLSLLIMVFIFFFLSSTTLTTMDMGGLGGHSTSYARVACGVGVSAPLMLFSVCDADAACGHVHHIVGGSVPSFILG